MDRNIINTEWMGQLIRSCEELIQTSEYLAKVCSDSIKSIEDFDAQTLIIEQSKLIILETKKEHDEQQAEYENQSANYESGKANLLQRMLRRARQGLSLDPNDAQLLAGGEIRRNILGERIEKLKEKLSEEVAKRDGLISNQSTSKNQHLNEIKSSLESSNLALEAIQSILGSALHLTGIDAPLKNFMQAYQDSSLKNHILLIQEINESIKSLDLSTQISHHNNIQTFLKKAALADYGNPEVMFTEICIFIARSQHDDSLAIKISPQIQQNYDDTEF